ncbi:hypothetical protein PHLGIDRAFT_110303 [Phlebiopsis gigantea 11061_1 CR5-6]|uniref:Uncharacterized protein n=1 Tax=Phlebiopsis gigantea (strain 11061_1 CR5-6) TaxID=745531 RepID=A0A0C3S655_PHLG1|nr:hypothetical protein PHLGIDRAFT_110303 [Phlebiopsis gigantea 11061_1 CR5-6]
MSPADSDEKAQAATSRLSRACSGLRESVRAAVHHFVTHTGVGIVCAVAYFDPGNWGVDLQAGSQYGYKLLFVVLLSGIFAVFLQILASRLGCVTGLDLAAHCRLLLHSRAKHTLVYRWTLLYPLYILSEAAIIATDLAELLGSAIALVLLFPKLPLWAGVLVTASDVFILLALKDPLGGKPVRLFEIIIGVLVLIVLICMAVIIAQVHVRWSDTFDGFLPSGSLFKSGGLYTSIGIIGATVMPHSIFLGSALSTQNRLPQSKDKLSRTESSLTVDSEVTCVPRKFKLSLPRPTELLRRSRRWFANTFRVVPIDEFSPEPKTHTDHENNSYAFVRAHIYHGMIDITLSLLGLAVVINSLILILASAVFYYGEGQGTGGPASLFDAYDLLKRIIGQGSATLFALALLASGQSSSIIATMAGQTVSEGFLRWRVSPIFRRVVTRAIGLVPAMAVAIAAGRGGVDTLLVASQVALSIVLPFIVFPLLYLTSSREIMSVKRDAACTPSADSTGVRDVEGVVETVDYSNPKIVTVLGWLLWIVIVAANVYAIVSLALGQE